MFERQWKHLKDCLLGMSSVLLTDAVSIFASSTGFGVSTSGGLASFSSSANVMQSAVTCCIIFFSGTSGLENWKSIKS